ncbi:MAG TPA: ferrous iron transport protein A [Anaerolineae bacterium]|nr:ferrous iron transport protein A [Caldilineae bacterium]HID35712.1 ferrous iron transport protein A [Anaerolineae bacterium]HIQ11426.1 ferrous iron transport protein A [Caldilineales bacterium]
MMSANAHTRPLSAAQRGDQVRLVRIDAGYRLARRLAELGLTPGVVLQIVHKNGGPMLIAVRGARLALGRGVTDKIQVTPVDAADASDLRDRWQ